MQTRTETFSSELWILTCVSGPLDPSRFNVGRQAMARSDMRGFTVVLGAVIVTSLSACGGGNPAAAPARAHPSARQILDRSKTTFRRGVHMTGRMTIVTLGQPFAGSRGTDKQMEQMWTESSPGPPGREQLVTRYSDVYRLKPHSPWRQNSTSWGTVVVVGGIKATRDNPSGWRCSRVRRMRRTAY